MGSQVRFRPVVLFALHSRFVLYTLLVSVLATPTVAWSQPFFDGQDADSLEPDCDEEPLPPECDPGPGCVFMDTADYFVPSYPGWQTARRIWTQKGGGQYPVRWYSYGSGKLREDSWKVTTATVTANRIYATSEQWQTEARVWVSPGAYWLPRWAYSNCKKWFRACWEELWYDPYPGCGFDHANPPHCAVNLSYVQHLSAYDFGGQVGVLEAIVKVDKLDNGEFEKYYYGLHRGFLRWEKYNTSGVLVHWSKQLHEIANAPFTRNACFLP